MSLLYAWATPALFKGSVLDHTWVTDFDIRVSSYPDFPSVAAAGKNSWSCWGNYHRRGGTPPIPDGLIGSKAGSVGGSQCLCRPNVLSKNHMPARGTIRYYGIYGVCHQLANQVLWSTRPESNVALTVAAARGYSLSTGLYGDYGIDGAAWQRLQVRCHSGVNPLGPSGRSTGTNMQTAVDSFKSKAASVLSEKRDMSKLEPLLRLREDHQSRLREIGEQVERGGKMPSAAEMNRLNNDFLQRADELLGPEVFERIFGVPSGREANVIDPDIFDAQTR